MRISLLIAIALITMPSRLVLAQLEEPFEQHGACDFNGFLESVKQVQAIRKERLLTAKRFAEFSKDRKTIVLDARGESDFVVLHVKGSKNLPYTSFGLKSLRELIPDTETRVLIYCRNNLSNAAIKKLIFQEAVEPVEPGGNDLSNVAIKNLLPYIEKSAPGGLNIPTSITLYSYGYKNVWELDEIVDPDDCPIEFVRQSSKD